MLGIMFIMVVFSTIVAYAAEVRDTDKYYPAGEGTYPVVEAYAYMNDSVF